MEFAAGSARYEFSTRRNGILVTQIFAGAQISSAWSLPYEYTADGPLMKKSVHVGVLVGFLSTSFAFASPATFVTALPVARDQLLVRFNFQPVFSSMNSFSFQFPLNIGYGLTSRWALFLNSNEGLGTTSTGTPLGRINLSSAGIGDLSTYARFTLFKIDKPKSTFRIAPLGGAFIPTGDNSLQGPDGLLPSMLQTGSGTLDPYFGITMGYNNARWGAAADSTFRVNPETGHGISPGDEFRADAQLEYRLLPWHLPQEGLPKLLVLSIESNYVHDARTWVNGVLSGNSGGDVFKQDAILEFTTLHWQLGWGAQLPLMQNLPGVGRLKEHCGAFLFFEYYLAAPSWRHPRRNS